MVVEIASGTMFQKLKIDKVYVTGNPYIKKGVKQKKSTIK
jgi:hypothetical protein